LPDAERSPRATEITQLLAEAVREAGALALRKFRTSFKSWTKNESSPVSEVDIEVDELLHSRLAGHDPSYGWLSEETTDDPARLDAHRVWIVDPIDGTRGFARKNAARPSPLQLKRPRLTTASRPHQLRWNLRRCASAASYACTVSPQRP